MCPNIRGFPGRMAMRQKSERKSRSANPAWTRSCSPTEAPPEVIRRSLPWAWSEASAMAPVLSEAMPISTASAPQLSTAAASATPLEPTI